MELTTCLQRPFYCLHWPSSVQATRATVTPRKVSARCFCKEGASARKVLLQGASARKVSARCFSLPLLICLLVLLFAVSVVGCLFGYSSCLVVWIPLFLDPSDGAFGRFDLAALCGCRTLNFCLFVCLLWREQEELIEGQEGFDPEASKPCWLR